MPPKTTNNTDALAEMAKKIAQLEAENSKLKSQPRGKIHLKVSEKGALSVYGMGRFPVTLYKSQWETLLAEDQIATIKAFIVEHGAKMANKTDVSKVTSGVGDQVTAPTKVETKGLKFDLATGKTIGPSGNAL